MKAKHSVIKLAVVVALQCGSLTSFNDSRFWVHFAWAVFVWLTFSVVALVTWVARQCQPRLWFRMEIIGYGLMISALSLIMLIVFLQRSFEVGVLVGLTIAPFYFSGLLLFGVANAAVILTAAARRKSLGAIPKPNDP